MRLAYIVAAGLTVAAAPAPPPAFDSNDLRDLRVGTPVAAMPAEGYAQFHCVAESGASIAGWTDFRKCPADAKGLRAVRFAYADGETKVAGHPVFLTALFNEDGRFDALIIETNPKAPFYLHKKAFLFGVQARGRFGDEGWSCVDSKPDATAEPVGGVFVKQTCTKILPGKTVVAERSLYRHPGDDLRQFVGSSRVTISAAP